MDNASNLLTVVMGLEIALMAVMKLDVVSNLIFCSFVSYYKQYAIGVIMMAHHD